MHIKEKHNVQGLKSRMFERQPPHCSVHFLHDQLGFVNLQQLGTTTLHVFALIYLICRDLLPQAFPLIILQALKAGKAWE